jgi:hypothetical protein
MDISVGCFVNNDSDLSKIKKIADKGVNCQLAFFHYEDFRNLRAYIPSNLKITSLHGFNSERDDTFDDYISKLEEFKKYFLSRKIDQSTDFMVTAHPNHFGEEFSKINWIYPENFKYKKKKMLKTPLHILKSCGRITLDTSHLDDEWLKSENLLKYLLMNADILHLSQRENNSSLSEHKPINFPGMIPMGIIIKTLRQYHIKEIVLEYMPEYIDRLIKDYFSLPTALEL